jgi:phosphoribosyl-dephospho-CoA transferase
MLAPRPHDLLWVDRSLLQSTFHPDLEQQVIPDWVKSGTGPVVIRRACAPKSELIPVGVRGENKSQRYATYISSTAIERSLSPFDLVTNQAWLSHPLLYKHPVLVSLQRIALIFDEEKIHWGITGSLGYELATKTKVLHSQSDLDLLIDLPTPISRFQAVHLMQKLTDMVCRVDIQLETPNGGLGLGEWASKSPTVLVKSATGPYLTARPWQVKPTKEGSYLC